LDTAAKLLGVNPIHDLTENGLFGAHDASLASPLLWKTPKPRSHRSHQFSYASHPKSATSQRDRPSKPDGNIIFQDNQVYP
jgi:hypothetical protein